MWTPYSILFLFHRSGIGFVTAQVLAQQGAKVYLAARNEEKAQACIKRIEESLPKASNGKKGRALFHQLDLTDPKAVKKSAKAFMEKEQRLDVLSKLTLFCCLNFFERNTDLSSYSQLRCRVGL